MLDLIPCLFELWHKLCAGKCKHLRDLIGFQTKHGTLDAGDHFRPEAKRLKHGVKVERCAVEYLEHVRTRVA